MILKVSSNLDCPIITQRGETAATLLFVIMELVNVAKKELGVPQRTAFWHPEIFQTHNPPKRLDALHLSMLPWKRQSHAGSIGQVC